MNNSSDRIFVFSGEFSVPRKELEDCVNKSGGKIAKEFKPALTKQTVLCVGENAKLYRQQEAQLYNIPIVEEAYIWESQKNPKVGIAGYLVGKENKRVVKKTVETQNEKEKTSRIATLPKILKKKVIALEGEIGAGKSTLSKKLQERYLGRCSIYEEQTNEGFLKLFYDNPVKYGFAFQWGMLKTRIFQLKLAQHDALTSTKPKDNFYIWDRSMIGDYIFAFWNFLQGSISTEEMDVYETEFGGNIGNLENIPFLENIHCLTLLNDEPSRCKFRVEEHRKNESEQGIPLSYYQGIDDIHFSIFTELLEKNLSKVVILNWGDYEDPEKVVKLCSSVISGKKAIPRIKRVPRIPSKAVLEQPKNYLYENAEQILEAYEKWSNNEESDFFPENITEIFIPEDVLTISPEEKNVVNSREDFKITFYQNEFKRIVYYHLSKFQNVYFYKLHKD